MVRRVAVKEAKDVVAAWAEELEGYEDLHASAAMRRDLFRNLSPLAIEEALRCTA
jgi:CO/xanthine dehydrogenase FAD-binding subunit